MRRSAPERRTDEAAAPTQASARGGRRTRRRALALAGSLTGHALVLLAILPFGPSPPRRAAPPPQAVMVELMLDPRPIAAPAAKGAPTRKPQQAKAQPVPTKQPPRATMARRAPDPTRREAPAAEPAEDDGPDLSKISEAELAGAGGSGGYGAGGGTCDMTRRLQDAVRRDPLASAAAARFAGRAVRVWNGDWIWIPGDDGKGLVAVRQAMMWEIAFAPAACKAQSVHGLVVIALNGAQGPVRLAVGHGNWRWSDLLIPHPEVWPGPADGR